MNEPGRTYSLKKLLVASCRREDDIISPFARNKSRPQENRPSGIASVFLATTKVCRCVMTKLVAEEVTCIITEDGIESDRGTWNDDDGFVQGRYIANGESVSRAWVPDEARSQRER